jgi:hypothetical protein
MHESLFRNSAGSTAGRIGDNTTPKSKSSLTASRTSSATPPNFVQKAKLQRKCPVRMIYSIINDCSNVESEEVESSVLFFNTCGPDEKVPTAIRLHADRVFCNKDPAAQVMTQEFVESTVSGEDSVVAMISDNALQRCAPFFQEECGLVARYCEAMISELEANGLTQLCGIRYCVARIEDDVMYQSAMHAGDGSDFRILSLADAESNSSSYVQRREDIEELIRELNAASSRPSDHVILILRVAPVAARTTGSHMLKGLTQLMKPLGCLCLVLTGSAGPQCTKKEAAAVRHSCRVISSVFSAMIRQWHRSSSDDGTASSALYVPYRDDTLTQALEPALDSGANAYLWLHLDGATLRASSSEQLQLADAVSAARYPTGRPAINFASLARQEHLTAVRLRQELVASRQAWEAERAQLESDRLMLRKACDATNGATDIQPVLQAVVHRDPAAPSVSDREALQMTKLMLATCQREKIELERSLTELRAQRQQSHGGHELAAALDVLASEGVVDAGDPFSVVLQLAQQLAEREKILGRVLPENDLTRKLITQGRWVQILSKLKQTDLSPRSKRAQPLAISEAGVSQNNNVPQSRLVTHEVLGGNPADQSSSPPKTRRRSNTLL